MLTQPYPTITLHHTYQTHLSSPYPTLPYLIALILYIPSDLNTSHHPDCSSLQMTLTTPAAPFSASPNS